MARLILIVSVSILGAAADEWLNKLNDPPLQHTSICKDLCKLITMKDLKEFGSKLDCDLEASDSDSTQCSGRSTGYWTRLPLSKIMPKLIANGCLLTMKNSTSLTSKNITAPDYNREAIITSTTSDPLNKLDKFNESIEIPMRIDNISATEVSDVDLSQNSTSSQPLLVNDTKDSNAVTAPITTIFTTTVAPMSSTTINITYLRCTKTCYTGPDLNFVCGTDLQTYANVNRIKCARSCGRDVDVLCEGVCPVCAASYYTTKATPTIENS